MSVPHYQTPPVRYAPAMAPPFGIPSVPAVNMSYVQAATTTSAPEKEGKASTVFVGNISESAPDDMIRAMLNTCGYIVNWKRAQGSSGKMQAFGFCTYQDPEAAIRAIKMLHNLEVGGKPLTVKVDENTKEYLENYKKDKSGDNDELQQEDEDRFVKQALVAILKNSESKLTKKEESDNEGKEGSDNDEIPKIPSLKPYQYNNSKNQKLDLSDLDVDDSRKSLISQEISKFRESYKNDEGPDKEEIEKEIKRREKEKLKKRKSSVTSDREGSSTEQRTSSKRKSKEREEKSSRHKRSRDRSPKRSSPSRRKRLPTDSPSPVRERIRRKEERRERSTGRMASSRDRDSTARRRDRERERRMSSSRRDERDARRSVSKDRRSGGVALNAEEEEERREEEKLERKLKEKEAAYQERLKIWETREKKKIREAEKDRERERDRIKEQIKEAKRLKEFLEEYDDQKEDMRFYTATALNRRLRDREKEKEIDERDRVKEKEELDEILHRLKEEGNPDPEAEVAKIVKEFEENMNKPLKERERELKDRKKKKDGSHLSDFASSKTTSPVKASKNEDTKMNSVTHNESDRKSSEREERANASDSDNQSNKESDAENVEKEKIAALMTNGNFTSWKQSKESNSTSQQSFSESTNAFAAEQQPVFDKKMTIEFGKKSSLTSLNDRQNVLINGDSSSHQLVNNYDSPSGDGSTAPGSPNKSPQNSTGSNALHTAQLTSHSNHRSKKKLQGAAASVFAEDDDDAEDAPKKRKLIPLDAEVNTPKEPVLTPQQKQQKVKELIAKIPTDRNVLFKYPVDWEKVDEVLMEERIKQWVNKKIQEYIGEEELTLVDFICGKVKNQCNPETLLNDVKMVLDDEAEVFIVKLWRLLIYETEAKKQGLSHIK